LKKFIPLIFATVILSSSSCTKDNPTIPSQARQFKVSFVPGIAGTFSTDWQQVLGGKASLEFSTKNSDTLTVSSLKDTIELKTIAAYRKPLRAGKYDIIIKTQSIASADTFIRFNAEIKDFQVNADGAIRLLATTSDGVITISKTLIQTGSQPTFTPIGSTTALNFGLANGYYFIYVKGAESGKITFTEATTGDEFMKNLTITAMTRYNLLPTLSSKVSWAFNQNRFF
jgi:hypothetical protein